MYSLLLRNSSVGVYQVSTLHVMPSQLQLLSQQRWQSQQSNLQSKNPEKDNKQSQKGVFQSLTRWHYWLGGVTVLGAAFVWYQIQATKYMQKEMQTKQVPLQLTSTPGDYDAVRKAIADILEVENYDDGSYGPLLVRLAWHCSGTYDMLGDC
eukprot:TRINITY_DN1879_c1_g1_i1.p2 TRINITY_DN1879_c1_g1~~TRINITY_DN1879_c1_g1_i1.p2  ORF type:complete len:152 (-),score=9.94 TRINITY_DN1879_c1_g1_i1:94-549(-)